MDYLTIYPFLIFLFLLFFLKIIGNIVIINLKLQKKLYNYNIIIGFSLLTLFLLIYTVVNIKIYNILLIFFILFLFFILRSGKDKIIKLFTSNIDYYYLTILILPLTFFFIIANFYGINFYVFRGNIWDSFNYHTMAVAYSKYKPSEIAELIETGNHLSFIANLNLKQRPSVVMIPAAILSIFKLNSFALMYMYKGFLLSVFASTLYAMIFEYIKCKFKSFLLAISIIFSMWVFYSIEIDAFSQLAYLSFIPLIFIFFRQYDQFNSKNYKIIFSILFAVSFLIYPEFASIILLSLVLIFISNFYKKSYSVLSNLCIIRNLLLPFIFITIIFYDQSVYFLFKQLFNGFTAKMDWWGYYGAYLLGPYSPITNLDSVNEIRTLLKNSNENYIYKLFSFTSSYLINVIPSIYGLFHVLSIKILTYPLLLLSLIYTYVIIKWFLNNGIVEEKWLKLTILILFTLILILCLRGNIWSAIRGFSYLSLLIPFVIIFTLIDFRLKKFLIFPTLILSLTSLFPIYKYSEFNHGIGVYDGFPSILRKSQKENLDWNFFPDKYHNCKLTLLDINDSFYRHYIILNFENYNLNYYANSHLQESYGFGKIITYINKLDNSDCTLKENEFSTK